MFYILDNECCCHPSYCKIPSARRRGKFYEEVIKELQFTADAVVKNTQQLLHYWALKTYFVFLIETSKPVKL